MRRLAALLLCAALVTAAMAAPAHLPRPSKVWTDGWDEPIDPRGDCRFDRDGDRLTITVPANKRRRTNAPSLLRNATGDFSAQVRVLYQVIYGAAIPGTYQAGLLLTDGQRGVRVSTVSGPGADGRASTQVIFETGDPAGGVVTQSVVHRGAVAYLRLERRGRELFVLFSEDGTTWKDFAGDLFGTGLPWLSTFQRQVKVGIFVQTAAPGTFQVEFSQFKLTPLGADGKPLKPAPPGAKTR